MRYLNDPWPWIEGRDRDLSMVDLIVNGTIPAGPAALLWWAVEHGASFLTAGGPSGAGKSTLANACLSFLPADARVYVVGGRDDPMPIPDRDGPAYLLISELSRHGRPYYISGAGARRAFDRVRAGSRVIGTLHADSVAEAITNLHDDIELSADDIARVTLIAITRVEGGFGRRGHRRSGNDAIRRRIVEIGLLRPAAERGVQPYDLATWDAGTDRLAIAEVPAGVAMLARWADVPLATATAAIAARADILAHLSAEGRSSPQDIEAAVRLLRANEHESLTH